MRVWFGSSSSASSFFSVAFGALALLLVLAGCRGTSASPGTPCGSERCASGEHCDRLANRCVAELPARCAAGTHWTAGTPAFREATSAWGLDRLHVEGVRFSVADIDGDGYPDVSVRRAGSQGDDFFVGGKRATWLLHNERGAGFADVTAQSGLVQPRATIGSEGVGRPAEVIVWADVDNDGDLDAFTGFSNPGDGSMLEGAEIMLNNGDGTFVLGPEDNELRRADEAVARAGASFVDYDRDGRIDLWLVNGTPPGGGSPAQDQLYRGLGDGHFREVTAELGLTTLDWNSVEELNQALGHSNGWGAAACDLNGDGTPELLAASYGRAPNHLWLAQGSRGSVHYVNRSIASGYAFDARVDWTDNESARCWCKLHPDDEGCAGVPPPAHIVCEKDSDAFRWDHAHDREPFRLGGNSATTVCADVNNDGKLDLVTTEIRHWDVGSSSDPSELLVNTGDPEVRFERPGGDKTGLTRAHDRVDWNDGDMTAAVFDFDNDGRPDVLIGSSDYAGTRAHLYAQREDGTFVEVPIADGIDHMSSHGIAIADFDGDGDLDVMLGHSQVRCEDQCYPTATARFFENVIGQDGNWVQLHLEGGAGTNRAAIGARVQVSAGGVTQTQEVGGGHGHFGMQQDQTLHFGLGAACEAEVTVRWPDAKLTEQRFVLQAGYRYALRQGEVPVATRSP